MKIWLDDLRPAPWGYESARSVNQTAGLAGGAGDLLPRGDPYRESSGQSEYGERAGEVLRRGVLVENLMTTWWQPPVE